MNNMNNTPVPIAQHIINYVQRIAADKKQTPEHHFSYKKAIFAAKRAIKRLPDEDTALMPGICAAYNVAYLAADAYLSRLAGHSEWANRLDMSRMNVANDPCPTGYNV